MHLDYVHAAANLKAEVYGLPQVRDKNVVTELVAQINVSVVLTFRNAVLASIN